MTTLMTMEHPGESRATVDRANFDRRWWILAVLGIAQLMVILDSTIVNIALPTAQQALRFSNADRQWIVTAYSLAFGSLLLLGGRIGDMVGRKRALLIGLVGFAVGVSHRRVLSQLRHARHRPHGPGRVRGAARPFGAGPVDHHLHRSRRAWAGFRDLRRHRRRRRRARTPPRRRPHLLRLVALDALRQLGVRGDRHHRRRALAARTIGVPTTIQLDLPGLFLVAGGLFCLVFGFSHAETTTWGNPYTIGFLVAGVVLLAVFASFETRATYPLLPPRVVRSRTRGGSVLSMLFASVGIFGVFLFLTYYLQGTLGFSPVKTGVAFLPLVGALAATAQVSNRVLLARFGPKPIVPLGLLVAAGALYGLHLVGLHTSYASHVLPYLLVLGLGFGLSVAPAFSTGTLGLAPQDAGVGSATLNTAQQIGGSIGTSLLNTMAASAAASYLVGRSLTPATLQAALLHSYTTAFLWSAAIFVAGAAVAGLLLPRGGLAALAAPHPITVPDTALEEAPRTHTCRVRVACR